MNCKWIGFYIPREFFKKFRNYTKKKNQQYSNNSVVEITGKEIIYFALKEMIEENSFQYQVEKEDQRETEEYLSAELPIPFIEKFEKYFCEKKKEAEERGEKLKVKRKWLLLFALNQVIDGDLFHR